MPLKFQSKGWLMGDQDTPFLGASWPYVRDGTVAPVLSELSPGTPPGIPPGTGAVRAAARPPDPEHLYGHGKLENVSALFETLLLLATCVWISYEAGRRLLLVERHVEVTPWAFLVTEKLLYGRSKRLSGVYVLPDAAFDFAEAELR